MNRAHDFGFPSTYCRGSKENLLRSYVVVPYAVLYPVPGGGNMKSSFKSWWGRYKKKLGRAGYDPAQLPPDFEEFINYLDAQPISLQEKQSIAKFYVKGFFNIPFKESKRNLARLRRANRYYNVYFRLSQLSTNLGRRGAL